MLVGDATFAVFYFLFYFFLFCLVLFFHLGYFSGVSGSLVSAEADFCVSEMVLLMSFGVGAARSAEMTGEFWVIGRMHLSRSCI